MSIVVTNITKNYGEQKALDDVSFAIQPGNIVGLLGPNGAGKSTMMKILTGFIPATSGTATINGMDVLEESLAVRRLVGYLPENNPLYHEMYVKEYLEFVAGIYHLKNKKARVDEMIELTGIVPEYRKRIGALSKGYRQRVGLAQALIHDPEILILDEPTSGLDPNQLLEIRQLIQQIGSRKTVMLSTHIMQEVTQLCQRVIIINNGKIVADDTTANLQNPEKAEQVLVIEFDKPIAAEKLLKIDGIHKAESDGLNRWVITSTASHDVRPDLFQLAVREQLTVLSLQKRDDSLEQIFQSLTKN
ncbi:MAG: gliding motility-associated ABC transporter ATP-binding subunit GldA [Bacteroidales bacterium]|jgi:ABC-2 type transport system ATP-binding protein|nr:gliding motility-associated ABC transporter ATP-binding subunit GldA [Bacteroidales bacterium]MDD3130332.1 gliding motility-associated ABC transporter ATP-binding subunit GldA [Bacteroidales bacterium]MDD3527112.1 gliding motility-associated ABC transporter ATP-binding subunit GldA [Bacteroidales bacterium]MDY0334776.1 gliding motility-associated ABC transporter ATP-binding subunit GldA [Bacteroidales bacterium]